MNDHSRRLKEAARIYGSPFGLWDPTENGRQPDVRVPWLKAAAAAEVTAAACVLL
jgi:hypothetical protein